MYATGVRCAELVGIKMRDIDMHNKTIRIIGKGRKERVVLFGQKAKIKVLEYIKEERPRMKEQSEHLFVSSRNTPLDTRGVQRIFEMFRSFLLIDRSLTPHKVRHSFATHLLNQGADLRMIQELLGHASLASTEKYTYVSSTQLAAVCDELHPLNNALKKRN
jgi:integrase/recombinase XerC